MAFPHNVKGQQIVRDIGVQHRSDDVSRVQSPTRLLPLRPLSTPNGPITGSTIDASQYFTLNTAFRVLNYRNTIGVAPEAVNWDDICVGVEVINDHATALVGVAFGGSTASAPSDSTNLTTSAEIKPHEASYFAVHVRELSIVSDTASTSVRVRIFLP